MLIGYHIIASFSWFIANRANNVLLSTFTLHMGVRSSIPHSTPGVQIIWGTPDARYGTTSWKSSPVFCLSPVPSCLVVLVSLSEWECLFCAVFAQPQPSVALSLRRDFEVRSFKNSSTGKNLESLEMDQMHSTLWDGPEPVEAKGAVLWFEY